jgi:hypothetical protein
MIYSESRSDIDILNDLADAKRIFLLGCPACANVCLYINKASENSDMLVLTPTGFKAVSMVEEIDRLKDLLTRKGNVVDSWVGKYPLIVLCVLDKNARKDIAIKTQGFDRVVVLSCDAGKMSVQKILPDKKVIGAMKAKGIITAEIKSKMKFAKLFIDKDSVDIMPFTVDRPPAPPSGREY